MSTLNAQCWFFAGKAPSLVTWLFGPVDCSWWSFSGLAWDSHDRYFDMTRLMALHRIFVVPCPWNFSQTLWWLLTVKPMSVSADKLVDLHILTLVVPPEYNLQYNEKQSRVSWIILSASYVHSQITLRQDLQVLGLTWVLAWYVLCRLASFLERTLKKQWVKIQAKNI